MRAMRNVIYYTGPKFLSIFPKYQVVLRDDWEKGGHEDDDGTVRPPIWAQPL